MNYNLDFFRKAVWTYVVLIIPAYIFGGVILYPFFDVINWGMFKNISSGDKSDILTLFYNICNSMFVYVALPTFLFLYWKAIKEAKNIREYALKDRITFYVVCLPFVFIFCSELYASLQTIYIFFTQGALFVPYIHQVGIIYTLVIYPLFLYFYFKESSKTLLWNKILLLFAVFSLILFVIHFIMIKFKFILHDIFFS